MATTSFTDVCDAVLADLTVNVPALRDARLHRYASWDPERFTAEQGERHLGVWPSADQADTSFPLVTDGGSGLLQVYTIAYWEYAGDESARAVLDEAAAADLLNLIEAIRARLYVRANQFLGPSSGIRYVGADMPGRSGQVRWIQLALQVTTSIDLS